MSGRTGLGLAALALGALAALWLALSPGWTVSAMADAARAADGTRIAGYVDADRVRGSVVEQLAAQMAIAQAKDGKLDPKVAASSMDFARRMAGGMDTAQVVSGAFAGGNVPKVRRTGLRSFTTAPGDAEGGIDFELQGVTWRAVGIRAPGRR